jgi:transcriptional regulator with XRE-family HTH domain
MGTNVEFRRLGKRLASTLRRRRRILDLTQETVAAEAGMTTRRYQLIEAGEQNVTLSTIERLSKVLRIRPGDLF